MVTGNVNLTCDAWQAGNTDGYFAVTGHWIDESTPALWEIKSALLGFVRLNNAHNGKRLGQTLFKVVKRLGIEHKVIGCLVVSVFLKFALTNTLQIGHVTCDNASNNLTMMQELAVHLTRATGKKYNWRKQKIK